MNLDTTLIDFSGNSSNASDQWRLEDAFRGVQIFGGIGSGKSSGSGRTFARAVLRSGFGGVVLCAKPDERENWERLAKDAGRSKDLIIFTAPEKDATGNLLEPEYFFNPLDYQGRRKDSGQTYNLVSLFMQIYQMGRVISGEGLAKDGERFWDNALKRCMSRMIDLLKLAQQPVSVSNMRKLITNALIKAEVEELNRIRGLDNKAESNDKLQKWAEYNYYIYCYLKIKLHYKKMETRPLDEIQEYAAIFHDVKNYFEREFATIAEKTKTIIVESFLGIAEPFSSGILKRYFAGATSPEVCPEVTFKEGKILVLDFPFKKHLDAGVYAQSIYKLLWQQTVERRKYKAGDIPVFLWVDEAQMALSSYDQVFQTTARSAGVCTVFLSQNISNYYVAIGGSNATSRANSLLGNLATKVFHANNDAVTNEWAAKTIGKEFVAIESISSGQSQSISLVKQLHFQVEPRRFTVLKSGGVTNDFRVEAIITVAGRQWSDGKNYIQRSFNQK